MSDDYLWNRSGEPDEEIRQLERTLSSLRYRPRRAPSKTKGGWWIWAAAAILLVSASFAIWRVRTAGSVTSWQLLSPMGKASAVRTGQVIETRPAHSATLQSESVGRIELEPDSRLRFLFSQSNGQQRLALERGTIHALIWAPPAQFVVDTPAAQAVDLGCRYTLHVAEDGSGLLTVETGWVAFQWRHRESFIPAGAACRTRPGHGPDTPYFLDAPQELVKALERFDETDDAGALRNALAAARGRDAFTLWHLMTRTQGPQREQVFNRFAQFVTVPTINRAALLRGDRGAFDAAWNALDLGDTDLWREWKRQW